MSENTVSNNAVEMKAMKMDCAAGSKEKGNLWELKGVEYKIPTTLKGWIEWLGEDKVLQAVETLDTIRRQDAARRAHVGGKNSGAMSDQRIRAEVVPNFRLFERTRIAAGPRVITPEAATAAIKTQVKDKAALMALIAELQKSAESLGE